MFDGEIIGYLISDHCLTKIAMILQQEIGL
jgi:hypothetical protein